MRVFLFIAVAVCLAGCGNASAPVDESSGGAATPSASAPSTSHLQVRNTVFLRADGSRFEWRGISAFALLEQLAHNREAEAAAYLDWAARQQFTIVRVLVMAQHLFKLSPEEGRAALPRLLDMAAERRLHVEVVALADTADVQVDLDAHVKAIGQIAAKHPNALVEIANEPGHPTQLGTIHDVARVQALAALVPDPIPVALGSAEYGDTFAGGDYATYHFPRDSGGDGWGHVLRLAEGAGLLARWKKPVVNDEPIGAGPEFIAGRRDNSPQRFTAAALLTRFAGMYSTFHYEGGLVAKIPTGTELQLVEAWNRGLELAAQVPIEKTQFLEGDAVRAVGRLSGGRSAFARTSEDAAWVLIVDPGPQVSWEWTAQWQLDQEWNAPGVRLLRGRRP